MDTTLRANVRQFAALWYSSAVTGGARADGARETAMQQVRLYLSDFGIGDGESDQYLTAAAQAIAQLYREPDDQN